MSYDLAVWRGPTPSGDRAAGVEFVRLWERSEQDAAPAPELLAFLSELRVTYPDLDDVDSQDCPWSSSPMRDEVRGDLLYLPMTFSGFSGAGPVIAALATAHGLVCFDPQTGSLLPASDSVARQDPERDSPLQVGSAAAAVHPEPSSRAARARDVTASDLAAYTSGSRLLRPAWRLLGLPEVINRAEALAVCVVCQWLSDGEKLSESAAQQALPDIVAACSAFPMDDSIFASASNRQVHIGPLSHDWGDQLTVSIHLAGLYEALLDYLTALKD